MKNTFRYIVIAASALLLSAVAFGQTKDEYKNAIKTKKTVEFNEETGVLERLVLETFVTGDGLNETTIITEAKPMDAILVLDLSGSMSSNCGTGRKYLGMASDRDVLSTVYDNYNKKAYTAASGGDEVTVSRSGNWYNYVYTAKIGNRDYTGKLFGAGNVTRLDALKVACESFIKTIKDNASKNNVDNTVTVIKFAGKIPDSETDIYKNTTYKQDGSTINYSQIVVNKASLNGENNFDAAINTVYGLSENGMTYSNYGMQLAKRVVDEVNASNKANKRQSTKLIVMFTDGEPSDWRDWSDDIANGAISISKSLKTASKENPEDKEEDDPKATVYTIATLNTEPANGSDIYNYLQGVSSNYPNATTFKNLGKKQTDPKRDYYKYAKDAASLTDIFETISHEHTEDVSKADVAITTSQVTVTDIIAPEFQIPAGADKITFFSAPATMITGTHGSRTENDYTWGAETAETSVYLVDASGNPLDGTPEKDENGKTSVSVKGFDFNTNWVGTIVTKEPGKDDKTEYHGRKLIIKIEIEPDPEFEGGFVTTNAAGSGVYVDGKNYQGITSEYEVDPIKVLSPKVNLVIRKSGLNPGETILYTVTRKDDPSYKIIVPLNADASGNATASVKADAFKTKTALWSYIVTEDNSWSWEYKAASESQEHALYKKVAPDPKTEKTEDLMCNVFDFGNAVLSDDGNALKPLDDAKTQTRYHEAAADNNFKEVSKVN